MVPFLQFQVAVWEKNEQFYTPGNVTDEETDIFDCQVCAKPPMASADNHPSNESCLTSLCLTIYHRKPADSGLRVEMAQRNARLSQGFFWMDGQAIRLATATVYFGVAGCHQLCVCVRMYV